MLPLEEKWHHAIVVCNWKLITCNTCNYNLCSCFKQVVDDMWLHATQCMQQVYTFYLYNFIHTLHGFI